MTQDAFLKKKQLFNRWAPSYDWLFPSVIYQAIHKRLLTYVQLPEHPVVLDLGCGTGRLLDRLATHFPNLQGTGLDLSPEMLHQAQQRTRYPDRLTYVEGNAEALPFAEGQFDAVFNSLSFLHYFHPQVVLAEVSRVLRPEGQFYLVDITTRGHQDHHVPLISPGGIRVYSAAAREQLGEHAGLRCTGHYYLLGPVLLTTYKKPAGETTLPAGQRGIG